MRILFVPSYSHVAGIAGRTSSDAIGFGVTSAAALVDGLRRQGCAVDVLPVATGDGRNTWNASCLEVFAQAVSAGSYDVVLAFHAFWPFAADLRRVLDDSSVAPALVGYTHGSHWDPSDLFRYERYPDLRWADLGNLLALDRILVVSEWMRDTLRRNVKAASEEAAGELDARMRVVGLPIDLARIDAARRPPTDPTPTVVFNHAPIKAKRPDTFLDLADELLRTTPARVRITRRFDPGSVWAVRADDLARRHPGRMIVSRDLPIDDYFAAMWDASVQVSTATHESLGVGTLEAMATRNHCLLPRCGAYPEVVDEDPDVLYSDDADLLERAVTAVTDPALRDRVAERLCRRARALYSPETIAGNVYAVLTEAATSAT